MQHPLVTTTKQREEVAGEVRSLSCTQPVRNTAFKLTAYKHPRKSIQKWQPGNISFRDIPVYSGSSLAWETGGENKNKAHVVDALECFLLLMQHMHYTEVQGCSQQRMQISSCKESCGQSSNAHLAALLPSVPATQGSPQSPVMKKNLSEDARAFGRGQGQNPLLSNSSPAQDVTAAGQTC